MGKKHKKQTKEEAFTIKKIFLTILTLVIFILFVPLIWIILDILSSYLFILIGLGISYVVSILLYQIFYKKKTFLEILMFFSKSQHKSNKEKFFPFAGGDD